MGYCQHDLTWQVCRYVNKFSLLPRNETVVVGVSGGPDSLCLLHILQTLAPDYGLTLHAAHLNHQLRGTESDQDARFVQALADEWGIACTIEACDVARFARREKLAIEEAARQCRYGFLARLAARLGAATIAVGHNADDQAESVLMHFIRGSGLAGLRGMLPLTRISDYHGLTATAGKFKISNDRLLSIPNLESEIWNLRLIRPLLAIPRAEIETYCQQHGLTPRFDRSNLDTTYFRNWLRHELLPLMETHNPEVRTVLCRTAFVLAADYELLHQLVEESWPRIVRAESGQSITFDLAAWRELPLALRRATLRQAIHRLRRTLRDINFVHVEDALGLAMRGQTGDRATLPEGLMLTISYDILVIASDNHQPAWPDLPLLQPGTVLAVAAPGLTPLPVSPWAIELQVADSVPDHAAISPWEAYFDAAALAGPLMLRARQPGDRFAPLGMEGHTKTLRDMFIHAKIPQARRNRMPLLVCGPDIVWVCGVQVAHHARVTPGAQVIHARFIKKE